MSAVWAVIAATLAALAGICIGDLASEEIRGRLDRLPNALIRLASHRIPGNVRDDLADEWAAEMHAILHGADALPVTRLVRGIRFGLGLLRTSADIGRQLNSRKTPTATPNAVRLVTVAKAAGGPPSGPPGGPTVRRMLIGAQFRRLRVQSGISREEAGERIEASEWKIYRLESGHVGFKERDVVDLLTLYGVTDPGAIAAILGLAREANDTGWWHHYGAVLPQWFRAYVDLEQAATLIRAYEGQLVPGLLQTDDYMRAVIGALDEVPEEIEQRVELRLGRQALLTRPGAPRLWAVIDESVLRRPVGGPRVMRSQLERLIEATKLPNVTLQILPFGAGAHSSMVGAFSIMRFAEDGLPDVVYLEHLTGAIYLDSRDHVDPYVQAMEGICVRSESPDRTADILGRIVNEICIY